MAMTQKQRDNAVITWRVLAIALLTVGQTLAISYLYRINNKIDISSDFRIQQIELNKQISRDIEKLESEHKSFRMDLKELGVDVREISQRQYKFESNSRN